MIELQRKANATVFLDWQLAKMMEMYTRLPAMGAGLVVAGDLVWGNARGVRKRGDPTPVKLSDRFHMGSITKPLTGYLMAVLCHQGRIMWNYTIRQTWPLMIEDLPAALGPVPGRDAWVAHYAGVRLWQMMDHSAGFAAGQPTQQTDAAMAALHADPKKGLAAKRRRYVELALRDRPYGGWQPGSGQPLPQPYTGGGIAAASMAETLTGRSWELLLTEHVLMPLGMHGFTFGNASKMNAVTDIWHHRLDGNTLHTSAFPFTGRIDYAHAPVGAVSLSVPSWALWMRALLKTGSDSHLSQAGLDDYFSAPEPGHSHVRGGLHVLDGGFGHNGFNGWCYADMLIDRELRVAALAATNIEYPGVSEPTVAMRKEVLAVGRAWPAMEHLSESLALDELHISGPSAPGHSATLVADAWFRTFWQASSTTPTLTVTLSSERWLKGVALCEHQARLIDSVELDLHAAGPGTVIRRLQGAALDAITVREGLVMKFIFAQPPRVKKLVLRLKATGATPPQLTRLMVMVHEDAFFSAFDISSSGQLWSIDHASRVCNSSQPLGETQLVINPDGVGQGRQVRRAAGKPWAIGVDGKLWRGESGGWQPVPGSPPLLRIAVDASNDWVWCVAADGSIRRFTGTVWRVHPGQGVAKDITVHAGKAWVVGSNDQAFVSTSTGWSLLPNNPGPLRRIAVDRQSLKLWALVGDAGAGRIYSRAPGAMVWVEHAGGGRGSEIAVHAGVPHVVGSSNNGLWRSTGSNWQALPVLQPRG